MRFCLYFEIFAAIGKPEATDLKASGSKADAGGISEKAEGKSKVKIVEPSKDDDDEDDEDEDEDDDDDDSAEDEVLLINSF